MLEPSFYRLYRRSRYSRSEDNQVTGSSQHQKEMFAVAAVAFVLKHDEKFRAHFLHKICGFALSVVPPRLRIEVQPHHHSDLAIKDDANSSVFIVEFKVGAELEPKQDPNKKAFLAKGGYGKLILEDRDYGNCNQKSYIVLDDDSKAFVDCDRQGLTCKSRKWADLFPECETVGGLWADLRDSFGELRVAAFQLERLKNMKNAKFTKQAVVMHQTLSRVGSLLQIGKKGGEFIDFSERDSWYGRHIPSAKLLNFDGLKKCVQAKKKPLGWFGYVSEKEHSYRAVTFWCDSDKAAKKTEAFILKRVRNGPPGKSVIYDGTAVDYRLDGDDGFGDAEWFDAVFKALADKKTV